MQGVKHKFHLIPSGILSPKVNCVIGNGVVVHLRGLLKELNDLRQSGIAYNGRLHLSDRAHIVFDFHQMIDGYNEKQLADKKIGTTLKGIGPSYRYAASYLLYYLYLSICDCLPHRLTIYGNHQLQDTTQWSTSG